MKTIAMMIVAAVLGLTTVAYADRTIDEGQTYTVTGTVKIVHYGLDGDQFVLFTLERYTFNGKEMTGEPVHLRKQQKFHLVGIGREQVADFRQMVGREKVALNVEPFASFTPHHHTPVIFIVQPTY